MSDIKKRVWFNIQDTASRQDNAGYVYFINFLNEIIDEIIYARGSG